MRPRRAILVSGAAPYGPHGCLINQEGQKSRNTLPHLPGGTKRQKKRRPKRQNPQWQPPFLPVNPKQCRPWLDSARVRWVTIESTKLKEPLRLDESLLSSGFFVLIRKRHNHTWIAFLPPALLRTWKRPFQVGQTFLYWEIRLTPSLLRAQTFSSLPSLHRWLSHRVQKNLSGGSGIRAGEVCIVEQKRSTHNEVFSSIPTAPIA